MPLGLCRNAHTLYLNCFGSFLMLHLRRYSSREGVHCVRNCLRLSPFDKSSTLIDQKDSMASKFEIGTRRTPTGRRYKKQLEKAADRKIH